MFQWNTLEYYNPLNNIPNKILLDGATMLHLINNADDTYLESIDCTGQDLLDAFEVCLQKIHKNDYIFR